MDISKDPRLVEYACTMTGLPEFHIMRTVLINIFGENDKISFENIEDMRRVIEENYTNEEFGIISSGVENINVSIYSIINKLNFLLIFAISSMKLENNIMKKRKRK